MADRARRDNIDLPHRAYCPALPLAFFKSFGALEGVSMGTGRCRRTKCISRESQRPAAKTQCCSPEAAGRHVEGRHENRECRTWCRYGSSIKERCVSECRPAGRGMRDAAARTMGVTLACCKSMSS